MKRDTVIAEVEKRPNSFRIRFYWFIGLFSFAIAALAIIAAWGTIVLIAKYLAYAVTLLTLIATIVGSIYLVWLAWHSIRHRARRDEAITREMENKASIITHDHNHVAYQCQDGQLYPIYAPGLRQPDLLQLPNRTEVDLLAALLNEQRVLIKGPSNTGKTNLLQWIASRKQNVLVLDPHSHPSKWAGCQVVGTGSNHQEIAVALDKLVATMVERYQDIAIGAILEGQHPPLTVIIDEWMSIAYQVDNAKQVMVRLLTESRKAAFSIYVGSHSERVASLGLDGKGDLRDGFCLVRLSLANGEYRATIDYGQGEVTARLPGKFYPQPYFTIPDILDTAIEPNELEAQILELYGHGTGVSQIAQDVYGQQNGYNNGKVKDVLAKFGVPIRDARVREDVKR
ncbi:MAG: RsfS/YbeB/iojap family protein [Anaerolineae bacterium]|nr:RsfS/YbeB/iojap family protein [Anaerolineae bacterium]